LQKKRRDDRFAARLMILTGEFVKTARYRQSGTTDHQYVERIHQYVRRIHQFTARFQNSSGVFVRKAARSSICHPHAQFATQKMISSDKNIFHEKCS